MIGVEYKIYLVKQTPDLNGTHQAPIRLKSHINGNAAGLELFKCAHRNFSHAIRALLIGLIEGM